LLYYNHVTLRKVSIGPDIIICIAKFDIDLCFFPFLSTFSLFTLAIIIH
jgi:hypothetical protein